MFVKLDGKEDSGETAEEGASEIYLPNVATIDCWVLSAVSVVEIWSLLSPGSFQGKAWFTSWLIPVHFSW